MIVPQFLRFYSGYTNASLMQEKARTFFALVNSMYRIESEEMLNAIAVASVPHSDKKDADKLISGLKHSRNGLHGILKEVRDIENVNKRR